MKSTIKFSYKRESRVGFHETAKISLKNLRILQLYVGYRSYSIDAMVQKERKEKKIQRSKISLQQET
jgi:hypothetical protein